MLSDVVLAFAEDADPEPSLLPNQLPRACPPVDADEHRRGLE
jgi:hypothetical protein